jgi:hypothetical protein
MANTSYKSGYKSQKRSRKTYLIPLACLLVAAAALLAYLHFHNSSPAPKATAETKNGVAKNSSKSSSSKNASKNDSKNATVSNDANQGTAKDQNGQAAANTSPSQWATSASQVITVKQPVAQATFKPGDTLSGTASGVSQVQYRLIDDNVGVVAQGFLNVVNGNFAGVMQFSPHGSTGRLDVFSTNTSGAEINEVQVPVKF